jgi:plasmid stability protein
MKTLTLRGVDPELEARLRAVASRESRSVNAAILDILRRSLGVQAGKTPYTDLDSLAGGWTEADLAEFRERTRPFDQIDEELWR